MNKKALVVTFFLSLASIAAASDEGIAAATSTASSWLDHSDALDADATWNEASPLFQANISREAWSQALMAAREPLGSLVSRQLEAAEFHTTLPGVPDGEYVVIEFSSSFSQKETAVETVTVAKSQDSSWQVAGYYVR